MSKIRKNWSSIVLAIIFIVGICLLAYPTMANWWNSNIASHAEADYTNIVEQMDTSEYDQLLQRAHEYNEQLQSSSSRYFPTDEEHKDYESQLSVAGSQVMGLIQVPSARIKLPIYHGTNDTTLAVGAGHLEGSSLPVGGIGTHAVITGHRGLPSAKLFTDLDKVKEGDHVVLKILNETLTYEIDTIRIVLPEEVEGLAIDPEKDLLTLVTCTPYGINTHRMLLTGHRIENDPDWEAVADASQLDTRLVALAVAIPILIVLFVVLMIRYRKPKGESNEKS